MAENKSRGFASMDREKQQEIARKGGEAVSKDRQHMAEIGKKGGQAVSQDRKHMAEIGKKGGEAGGGGRHRRTNPPLPVQSQDKIEHDARSGF